MSSSFDPAIILYDSASKPHAVKDGVAIPVDTPSLLIAGQNPSGEAKHLRMAADGTVRTDPTGTTTQPISATSLPLPTGAATESTLATRATESTLATRASESSLLTRATEITLLAVESVLTAIRDTAGIKKITDKLPAGDNDIGSMRLRDIAGNGLVSILDNAIRRLETRSSLVGQVQSTGTEQKVTTIADTEIVGEWRLQTEARIAPGSTVNIGTGVPSNPSDLVVSDLLNGASADMLVNGSLATPVHFSYAPGSGEVVSLQQLRITFIAGSLDFGTNNFGPNGALANGVNIEIVVDSISTILRVIKRNEDFLVVPGEIPYVNNTGVNDFIILNVNFGGAVKLNGDNGDLIRMSIRDNLTAPQFNFFEASIFGQKA